MRVRRVAQGRPVIHIGFTGTQDGMTTAQAERVLDLLHNVSSAMPIGFRGHHGLCVGSDIQFDGIARQVPGFFGMTIHPCDIPHKQGQVPLGRLDLVRPIRKPLDRNRAIVAESDIIIATPKEPQMQLRSGTWTTVRYALEARKPVAIVLPDGGVVYDGPPWP